MNFLLALRYLKFFHFRDRFLLVLDFLFLESTKLEPTLDCHGSTSSSSWNIFLFIAGNRCNKCAGFALKLIKNKGYLQNWNAIFSIAILHRSKISLTAPLIWNKLTLLEVLLEFQKFYTCHALDGLFLRCQVMMHKLCSICFARIFEAKHTPLGFCKRYK